MLHSAPNRGSVFGRAVFLFALLSILVVASAPPTAAAVRINKTFGSWSVVCIEAEDGSKRCSMSQTHAQANQQTKQRRLVLRWTISIGKNQEQTQSLAVPAGVSIKEGVRVFFGDAEPIVISYSFCGPRLCVATAPLDAKAIAAIRGSQKASASYVRGSKQLAQVQFDLKGFAEAYDFLAKQLSS